jgi:hypothetical protein
MRVQYARRVIGTKMKLIWKNLTIPIPIIAELTTSIAYNWQETRQFGSAAAESIFRLYETPSVWRIVHSISIEQHLIFANHPPLTHLISWPVRYDKQGHTDHL